MIEDQQNDRTAGRWRAKARARLCAWVLFGDIALTLTVLLSLACVIGCSYGAYYLWFQSSAKIGRGHFFVFVPVFFGGVVIAALAYGWFTTRKPARGVRLEPKDAPELHALVRDCAVKLAVRPPVEVWLVDGCTVFMHTRLRGLASFGTSRRLAVGSQLLTILTLDQARAAVSCALGSQSISYAWAVSGAQAQRRVWDAAATPFKTVSQSLCGIFALWYGTKVDYWLGALAEEQRAHADSEAVKATSVTHTQAALLRWAAWQPLFARARAEALSRSLTNPVAEVPRECRAADAAAVGNLTAATQNLREAWHDAAAGWDADVPDISERHAAIARTQKAALPPVLPPGGGALQKLVPTDAMEDYELAIAVTLIYESSEARTALAGTFAELRALEAHEAGIQAAESGGDSDATVVAEWLKHVVDAQATPQYIYEAAKRAGRAHPEHRMIMATRAQYALMLNDPDALQMVDEVPDGEEPLPEMYGELMAFHARHGRLQESDDAAGHRFAAMVVTISMHDALSRPPEPEWIGAPQMPPLVHSQFIAVLAQAKSINKVWIAGFKLPNVGDKQYHAMLVQPKFVSFKTGESQNKLAGELAEKLATVPGLGLAYCVTHSSAKRKLRKAIEKSGTLLQIKRLATPDTAE